MNPGNFLWKLMFGVLWDIGDLNAAPGEAIHGIFEGLGYASAHRALKGHEPRVTWPTGIKAPFAEEGEADCLDYIYIWQAENFVCRCV